MRSNLTKIFSNQTDLSEMEFKSSSLKASSETFSNQASRLERQTRMRRNRMYLILASMVAAFILFIFLFN